MTEPLITLSNSLQRVMARLPEFIPYLEKRQELEVWHRNLLGCILIRLRTHLRHLHQSCCVGYEVEHGAWAARNLLELWVWATFATASKDNAKRLHEDSLIDASEMLAQLHGLFTKVSPADPALVEFGRWKDVVKSTANAMGIPPDASHLNVGTVAKDVDMATMYFGLNGILSKLVHPTALSLTLNLESAADASLRQFLFTVGLHSGDETLKTLIGAFESARIPVPLLKL